MPELPEVTIPRRVLFDLEDAFQKESKSALHFAASSALEFVNGGKELDRTRAQRYQFEAEIWNRAAEMARKAAIG